jgi:flagellar hook-associated protein 2
MIDQIMNIERRGVDSLEGRKAEYEAKLAEWRSFNTKLLSLKTAAERLKDPDDFYSYSSTIFSSNVNVDGDAVLSVSASTDATPGTYTISVSSLAKAQKLSSNPFSSRTEALGSTYAGEIVINGRVLSISSTDSLSNIGNKINGLNSGTNPSGVRASIVSYSANDHRLVLTSEATGDDGISLLNGSSTNLLQKFGWKDGQAAMVKNSITQGAQSNRFTAPNIAIQSLLGLAAGEASTGSLTIGGTAVAIDLSTMSLTDIRNAINTAAIAGVVATVASETEDNKTYYRLQIEGTQSFVDENNILNTLGILDHGSSNVNGRVSGNSMTANGSIITASTLLTSIDGYISYNGADNIQLTGTKTGGEPVNHTYAITSSSTVGDLLAAIEAQFGSSAGDTVAYVTGEGKIRVDDIAGGGSLSVTLTDNITSGALEFVAGDAAFGEAAARQREIVAGEDAVLEVDGVEVKSASNVIKDVIAGVTLTLLNEDAGTTLTLNIDRDLDAIKSSIKDFVDKYNQVMTTINSQFSYNQEEKTTGGVLFGDGTLSSVKTDLTTLLTRQIWGVNSEFSILGLIGITVNNDLILGIDDAKLTGYLKSNFNDVLSLLAGQGSTTSDSLTYIDHSRKTASGEYMVHIHRAATKGSHTGSVDLTAGGADETLTITQGDKVASIALSSDMTILDIVNEINSELGTQYAETLVGDQSLQAGGVAISSGTPWEDIDGASLQNGDTVSFTGTSRNGASVSGSYQIEDISTDTVRGLLSSIEKAFSNDVTASLDTSGRLVLTDKLAGASQISLSLTEPEGRGLDFGEVDVTAGAGDGSQEGRYALSVTASHDGAGHLVLTNADFGSAGFTISQDSSDGNYLHILSTNTSNTTETSGGTVSLSESTTWEDVFGADVASGDTITISGKARDGVSDISGTYTINDISTDTLAGLLTTIENAYAAQGTSVTATLRDGKITVEDAVSGSSSIALTLTPNNEGGGSLSLGVFDETTRRDLDLGLINGTVSGQNVAGTINGEEASGSGQILSGSTGNANTDGLSVKFTGTSDNFDAGDVKVTLGVAEMMDRALYGITDPQEGYASFRQESLGESIERFKSQIEEMEGRLDKKMEHMVNRFVIMEMALSSIQIQSQWLAGQITSSYSGWRSL